MIGLDGKVEVLAKSFSACGLAPFDPEEVYKRLPKTTAPLESEVASVLNETVLDHLVEARGWKSKPKINRGTKLITCGTNLAAAESQAPSSSTAQKVSTLIMYLPRLVPRYLPIVCAV